MNNFVFINPCVYRICIIAIAAITVVGTVFAQTPAVAPGGIVNHFSYATPGLPNADIAQGSVFDIYGTNIGPAALTKLAGFPIPTIIANTSVQLTVEGTTVDVYLFFVSSGQTVGVVPSRTPIGTGTLTVTVNGQRSAAVPIKVVAKSIGILSLNQAGYGPAAMQMPDGLGGVPLNSFSETINPLGVGVFYGTGGGAVTFDETNAAPVGDLPDIRALVGGKEARLLYKGRAPGYVGLDQFNVEIPADVSGCYVPVAFRTGNVVSNYTTISVAESGACSDPKPPPALSGIHKVGIVGMGRSNSNFPIDNSIDTFSSAFKVTDFSKVTPIDGDGIAYRIGPCTVLPTKQPVNPNPPDNSGSTTFLDAGPLLALTGPNGPKQIERLDTPGNIAYPRILGGGLVPLPGASETDPLYLSPGTYTINNGAGVPQGGVGPFTASFTIDAEFVWTNGNITSIERSQGFDVKWTGAQMNSIVNIRGSSIAPASATHPEDVGYLFLCNVPSSAGHFNVPPEVLLMLPPNDVPTGTFTVHNLGTPVRFNASGLDYGEFGFTAIVNRLVQYK
jgi:uncharacterized protein (TIGR03437 family)